MIRVDQVYDLWISALVKLTVMRLTTFLSVSLVPTHIVFIGTRVPLVKPAETAYTDLLLDTNPGFVSI